MNAFELTAGIVLPMFLLMLCGYLLRILHILPENSFPLINRLCFHLLLPAGLLNSLLRMDDLHALRLPFLGWLLLLQVLILMLLYLTVPRFVPDRRSAASIIQAAFRSNFLTFGLVIAQALCAPEELGIVSISAGILIPLYNIGGILILQHACGGKTAGRQLLLLLVRNPFVIVCIAGLAVTGFHIPLPSPVRSTVSSLGSSATTISLLALGGSMDLSRLRKTGPQVIFGTVLRLVLLPMVLIPLSYLAGFRSAELLTVTVMAISPTAVATFPMAQRMGGDGPLAGYLVASQSVFSVLTMFLWLFLLSGMGWIAAGPF